VSSLAQLDETYIKPLTKPEIIEFYREFFSPSSTKRARVSVHLHARGAGELDTKIMEILSKAGLQGVPAETRQSIDLLERHLEEKLNLPKNVMGPIIAEAKEAGLKRIASDDHSGSIPNGSTAVASATDITDLRRFKSGLMVSLGARPVKDLSEFEEVDAKL
jgi:insulysin